MKDFGTLIYTDCRPGQGLSGGAGLQFQASSPDVDGDAMRLVQQHLLYEPPSAWMRDQRPVTEYPPSFAHIGGDQYATAAGVYLGQEANGTREGNQLTHAVATRDPDSYGLLRPAQLFGAPFWTTEPAASTHCEPVPAGPEAGVLDSESVHAFVSRHPDGPELLAALLSVLTKPDDGQAPQVLFIADQVEPVLTWVAAATLLLPHRAALRIGFKVFTTTAERSAQRILAVHPGWETPPASVDRPGGYLVVDLLAGRWSDFTPDPMAQRWAAMYCSGDPFDVTDAVELAAGSGLPPAEAMSLARVAVLNEAPDPADAEAVVGWLSEGPGELRAAFGVPVAATFTADVANQPVSLLRKLDRATRDGRFDDQAVPVRMALLAAELRAAAKSGFAPPEEVPPVVASQWGALETDRAVEMVVAVLREALGAGFAAVLTVAERFRLPLRYADIGAPADRFVADWARHPAAPYRVKDWPCGTELHDLLRDHLSAQLDAKSVDPRTIGESWVRTLKVRDPEAALDAALAGARMAASPEPERIDYLTGLLTWLNRQPDSRRRVTALAKCAWRWIPPTMAELRSFAGAMPPGAQLDPDAVSDGLTALARDGLTTADLKLIAALVSEDKLRPARSTEALLRSDNVLRRICAELPELEKHDRRLATRMEGLRESAVRAHRTELITALLNTTPPETVVAVLEMLPSAFREGYLKEAAARLDKKPAPRAIASAMVVISSIPDDRVAKPLRDAVNKWANWAGSGPVDQVSRMLARDDFQPASERWADLLDANKIRRGRSWLRGPKGR